MNDEGRSRVLGRLLMAGAVLQLLIFLVGFSRRSYFVVALPVGAGLGVVSALAFWVGYTMAYADWDDEPLPDLEPDSLAGEHAAATAPEPPPAVPAEPEESYGAGG